LLFIKSLIQRHNPTDIDFKVTGGFHEVLLFIELSYNTES